MKFKNKEELSKAYDELEKAYTKECQENKKLKEQLKLVESDQSKIWSPNKDEKYWIIDSDGEVACLSHYGCSLYINYGNYFKTKEEAEKQAEYNKVMNRFRKYVGAYSEPLYWKNVKQKKFFVYYDGKDEEIVYTQEIGYEDAFKIYASSKQALKDAIIYSAGSEEEFIRIVFGEKNDND